METNLTHEQKGKIVKFLTGDRMENYGYSYQDWNRIRSQRQRAKNALWKIGYGNIPAANWSRILWDGRLMVTPEGEVSYTTGQSSNEEITNLMRRLVNPNAKWVS